VSADVVHVSEVTLVKDDDQKTTTLKCGAAMRGEILDLSQASAWASVRREHRSGGWVERTNIGAVHFQPSQR